MLFLMIQQNNSLIKSTWKVAFTFEWAIFLCKQIQMMWDRNIKYINTEKLTCITVCHYTNDVKLKYKDLDGCFNSEY